MAKLPGKHRTAILPLTDTRSVDEHHVVTTKFSPKVLVWSAADEDGISRLIECYKSHLSSISRTESENVEFLNNLAFTLDSKRSSLTWKAFCVIQNPEELTDLHSSISIPIKSRDEPIRTGFVFTGQGAQWASMGKELLELPIFKSSFDAADQIKS